MFFLEIQQLAEALIFLDGGGAVSRLLLSLGQLRAQTLVFGNELVIVVKISIKALKPSAMTSTITPSFIPFFLR